MTPRLSERKLVVVQASSVVRKAVAIYAGLFALLDLVVLLPGDPSFSRGGLVGSLLIQGLLVWRLSYGSVLAWAFGLLIALGGVASIFLAAIPFDLDVTLIVILCLAQAAVLLAPPLRRVVWPTRRTPPASA